MYRTALFAVPAVFCAAFAACGDSSTSPEQPAPTGSGDDGPPVVLLPDGAAVLADGAPAPDGAAATVLPDGGAIGDAGHGADAAKGDVNAPAPNGQWVLGYYVGYSINSYPIAQIDWTGITHIAFSPMTVNGDLSLNFGFADVNGTGVQDAKAIAAAAKAHGVHPMIMLGGAGAGANIAKAATATNRAAFVSSLVSALGTLGGYEGYDLDWEDSVNLDDLVSLAQDLRAAKPDILLSVPGGVVNPNYQTVDARLVTLAKSLDRYFLQTYYPSTATIGSGWDSWFNSPLSGRTGATPIAIDDNLALHAKAGIPKGKLGMGISFYAICYTGGITGPRQPTSNADQIVGGDNAYPLSAFFTAGGLYDTRTPAEKQRDTTSQVPFLGLTAPVSDGHCGASTQYLSYEDETSIEAKGAFSKANGYGGVIVWTLEEGWLPVGASEGRAQNALMQALRAGFIGP